MLACVAEAATAYHVPIPIIERVLASVSRSAGSSPSAGVGPMGIPGQWLPVLAAYGFSLQDVRKDPCWGIAAGAWILAVERMYAGGGNGVSARGHFVYPGVLPSIPTRYVQWANRASASTGVPAALILAVAAQESGFNPDAVSPKGAQGLMQFMPGTWDRFGEGSPFDPKAAIFAGARYLRYLAGKLGSWKLAIAGYNAGGQAVVNAGYRVPPFRQTQRYVPAVLARYQYFQSRVAGSESRAK
jgi:soluble lytic murein transglycosylase-like protein